jgi:hypothetical protein
VNFYGFTVKRDKSGDFWVLRIHSAKDRPMKVYVRDGAVRAEGRINGRAAFLRQMYVSYKLDSVIPGVEYVDLIGVDAHTGAPLRERYKP